MVTVTLGNEFLPLVTGSDEGMIMALDAPVVTVTPRKAGNMGGTNVGCSAVAYDLLLCLLLPESSDDAVSLLFLFTMGDDCGEEVVVGRGGKGAVGTDGRGAGFLLAVLSTLPCSECLQIIE